MRNFKFIFLFAVFLTGSLSAEAVYMRSGDVLTGAITAQDRTSITLITDGKLRRISKSQIARITYESPEQIAAKKARLEAIRRAQAEKARQDELIRQEIQSVREQYERQFTRYRAERARYLREQVEKGNIEKPDEPIGYLDFAWRSAVLPGWGHIEMDRPVIGYTYMFLTAAALVNVADKYGPASSAQATNEDQVLTNTLLAYYTSNAGFDPAVSAALSIDANRNAAGDYQKRIDQYNQAWATLGIVYGVQMIHIIYNGLAWEDGLYLHRNEPGFAVDMRPHAIMPDDRGAALTLSWRF